MENEQARLDEFTRFFVMEARGLKTAEISLDRFRQAHPGRSVWTGSWEGLAGVVVRLTGTAPVPELSTSPRNVEQSGHCLQIVIEAGEKHAVYVLHAAVLEASRVALCGDGIVQDWDERRGPLPASACVPITSTTRPVLPPPPPPPPPPRTRAAAPAPAPAATPPPPAPAAKGIRIVVGMSLEEVTRLLGQPKTRATAAQLWPGPLPPGIPSDMVYAIYEHATGKYCLVFRGGRVAEVNQHP